MANSYLSRLERGEIPESEAERWRNLCILAVGLYQLSECPAYKWRFSMSTYARAGTDVHSRRLYPVELCSSAQRMGAENCRTVACALGHGPLFGISPGDGVAWNHSWESYGEQFATVDSYLWNWLFDGEWSGFESQASIRSASERIAYVLGSEDDGVEASISEFLIRLGFGIVPTMRFSVGNNMSRVEASADAGEDQGELEEEALVAMAKAFAEMPYEAIIGRMKALLTPEQLSGIAWTEHYLNHDTAGRT